MREMGCHMESRMHEPVAQNPRMVMGGIQMSNLIYLWDAFRALAIVFGFMYMALWAFAKVMQTDEDWDRDE
jgi:hypothetical protein